MNYKILGAAALACLTIIVAALTLTKIYIDDNYNTFQTEQSTTSSISGKKESTIKYIMSDAKRLSDIPLEGNVKRESSYPELTIYIGDSRTVGMESVMDDGEIVIAKVGEGYSWYKNYAKDELINTLDNNSDKSISVIFNLGVNDLHNAPKYVEAINELSKAYPDVGFSYMSVNPVETTTVSNNQINTFNDTIKKMLDDSVSYIDAFTYLVDNGYDTVDGLHYTKETYKDIYDFVCETTM